MHRSPLLLAALAAALVPFFSRTRPASPALSTQGVVARPTSGAITLDVAGHPLRVAFVAMGRATLDAFSASAPPLRDADAVRYRRAPGVEEWWRETSAGLEHGLTIDERPAGTGPLRVEVGVEGSLRVASADGTAALLGTSDGTIVARYDGLAVLDRGGARLPATMRVAGDGIVIEVDDTGARYPVVVDPVVAVHEAMLTHPTPGTVDFFGAALDASADGTRVVVGAPYDDTAAGINAGTAWVFVRTGTNWALESELVPVARPPAAGHYTGTAVAMSADGTRALVGRPGVLLFGGAPQGAVSVFVRGTGGWTEEATLDGVTLEEQSGEAVDLSADGGRAVVGSRTYGNRDGRVRVYRRSGSSWALEQDIPSSDPPFSQSQWGGAVAISGDGLRIAGSLPRADTAAGGIDSGSVRMMRFSGGTWVEEQILLPSFTSTSDGCFDTLALDAGGSRLIGGCTFEGTAAIPYRGAAVVFVRTGRRCSCRAERSATGVSAARWRSPRTGRA